MKIKPTQSYKNPLARIRALEHDPVAYGKLVLARATDPRWRELLACYAIDRAKGPLFII